MTTLTTTISSISVKSEAVVKTEHVQSWSWPILAVLDCCCGVACHATRSKCPNIASEIPTSLGAYMVTTRIASIAYDAKSVTLFLVCHVAVVEPACLRFSKTCHDGRVLSNRG